MRHKNVKRISVSIPPDLLSKFDGVMKKAGFKDRSKGLQVAMRTFISENEWLIKNGSGEGAGSIELLYDPRRTKIQKSLTAIQHRYESIVSSSTHVHLNDHNCLETVIVKGDVRNIKKLAKELADNRGIKNVKVNFVKVI